MFTLMRPHLLKSLFLSWSFYSNPGSCPGPWDWSPCPGPWHPSPGPWWKVLVNITGLDRTYHVHQFIFSFFLLHFFLFVPCGRLPLSFWAYCTLNTQYRIVSYSHNTKLSSRNLAAYAITYQDFDDKIIEVKAGIFAMWFFGIFNGYPSTEFLSRRSR